MALNIFDRADLTGPQSANTLVDLDDLLQGLLENINNNVNQLSIELKGPLLRIPTPTTYTASIATNLLTKHAQLLDSTPTNTNELTLLAQSKISALTQSRTQFTTLLNSKATITTALRRPTLRTVLNAPTSGINKQYVVNNLKNYLLPTPIPNTKLYVNREGTGYFWG